MGELNPDLAQRTEAERDAASGSRNPITNIFFSARFATPPAQITSTHTHTHTHPDESSFRWDAACQCPCPCPFSHRIPVPPGIPGPECNVCDGGGYLNLKTYRPPSPTVDACHAASARYVRYARNAVGPRRAAVHAAVSARHAANMFPLAVTFQNIFLAISHYGCAVVLSLRSLPLLPLLTLLLCEAEVEYT